MRPFCLFTALLLTLSVAGCGKEEPRTVAVDEPVARHALLRQVIGCYALFDARGEPASHSLYGAPDFVQLDSAFISDSAGMRASERRAIPLDSVGAPRSARGANFGGPRWTVDSLSDTLRLTFHDGFSGSSFVVAPASSMMDTLTGWALESFDVGPTSERHEPVRIIRQRCSESTQ